MAVHPTDHTDLGTVAHRAALKTLAARPVDFPFARGAIHRTGMQTLLDSNHCSRYNTQTGRLTEDMLRGVVELAARHAGLIQ